MGAQLSLSSSEGFRIHICEPLAISHLEFSFSSLELVPTKIPLN